jgi:tetratricopeptide (TPR) repeat protein
MGRPDAGLGEASAALTLARDLDAPENQAYALWHRSEALSGLGRADEAGADAREALTIARGLGHRGWTATAYRAVGIALVAAGELDDAAAAFAASGAAAGESLTLFAAWAAARSALVAIARGELRGVEEVVARALGLGPPLGQYEARLARVELLAARADPSTSAQARAALAPAAPRTGDAPGHDTHNSTRQLVRPHRHIGRRRRLPVRRPARLGLARALRTGSGAGRGRARLEAHRPGAGGDRAGVRPLVPPPRPFRGPAPPPDRHRGGR